MSAVALVYTAVNEHLATTIEGSIRDATGSSPDFASFSDPGVLEDLLNRHEPEKALERAREMLRSAAQSSRVVLSVCTSLGEIADEVAAELAPDGSTVVRIDRMMADDVVAAHHRVAILATAHTAIGPTTALIERAAAEQGREVSVRSLAVQVDGSDSDAVAVALSRAAAELHDQDCIVLAQPSMHRYRSAVADAAGLPVYTSPDYGARAVAAALEHPSAP
jgi:aspartate/glutamate racemase